MIETSQKTDREKIDLIISEGWNNKVYLILIANKLNEQGFKTNSGLKWTENAVSTHARKVLGLPNRINRPSKKVEVKQEETQNQESFVEIPVEQPEEIYEINAGHPPKTFAAVISGNLVLNTVEPIETKIIKFNDVDLVGVKSNDGNIYVALKKICDDLGLDWSSQLQRIKRDADLTEGMVIITIPNLTNQKAVCLNIDLLAGFLFNIETSRCKPEIQPYLKEFKKKAYKVLFDAFIIKDPTPKVLTIEEQIIYSAQSLIEHKKQIEKQAAAIEETQKVAKYLISEIAEMKNQRTEAIESLKVYEYSDKLPLEVETKNKIVRLVRTYVLAKYKNPIKSDFREAWNRLYRECYYRLGVDLKTRAENQARKTGNKKINGLFIAEELNILNNVFDIASAIFRISEDFAA